MAEPFDPIEPYDPILPDKSIEPDSPESPGESIELDEPVLPKRSIPAPLPRLWKTPPEPGEVNESAPSKGKKNVAEVEVPARSSQPKPSKKKKIEDPVDDGTGASKLEETPVLDTYEARQRARWLIGGLLGLIGAIALFLVLKTFRGNDEEVIHEGEPPEVRLTTDVRSNGEIEARNILENAKNVEKAGKTEAAVALLNKLTKTYPGTAATKEALNALERHRLSQSLFGLDAREQAIGPKPPNSGSALPTKPAPPKSVAVSTEKAQPEPISPDLTPKAAPAPVTPLAPPIVFKPLPRGYRTVPNAPTHPSGWPTRILCDLDGSELVLVPGGTFMMGRDDGDSTERPAHPVTLSTYYIDLHEVTVRQYLQYLKETGRSYDTAKLGPDDHPAVNVSAREAKAYCQWAGRKLPTEAQWEMAARAPNGRISFWNGDLPRKDPLKGPRLVEPVMTLPSDLAACGAYDMGANAWEWTSEYYDSQYYQQFRAPVTDPTGPKESRAKLAQVTVKGGSKSGSLTWREGQKLETRLPYLGFRGALPVEGLPVAPPSATIPAPANNPNLPGGVPPL